MCVLSFILCTLPSISIHVSLSMFSDAEEFLFWSLSCPILLKMSLLVKPQLFSQILLVLYGIPMNVFLNYVCSLIYHNIYILHFLGCVFCLASIFFWSIWWYWIKVGLTELKSVQWNYFYGMSQLVWLLDTMEI